MIVIDASALVKLVLSEPDAVAARDAYRGGLQRRERMVVPYLALPEVLNTIWKYHTLRKELSDVQFKQAVNDAVSIFRKLEKFPEQEVAEYASAIAHRHKMSFYDAVYVATSLAMNGTLLTFDKPLAVKATEAGADVAKF